MSEPSPKSVRRSLRALTEGSAPARLTPTAPDPGCDAEGPETGLVGAEAVVADTEDAEDVISDAESAVSCACAGARFVAAGRLSALDAAVRTATRCGTAELARRGRTASATLRRFETALRGHDVSPRSAGVASDADCPLSSDSDHFHSARGTVLGRSGQDPGR